MERDKRTPDSLKALNKGVLPVLYRRFYNKGLMPIEIIRLAKDILNIIGDGGLYNADILNKKLERLGWKKISWITIFLSFCFITLNVKEHIKSKFLMNTLSMNLSIEET